MAGAEQPLLREEASAPGGGAELDAEVLVVGAGPVGLLTAIELARRSIRVRIIDRWPQQDIKTKAIGVQKGSLQVLPLPVVERILEGACIPTGMRIQEVVGNNRKVLAHIRGVDKPAKHEFPQMVCIEQWKTEKFMEDHLRSLGVQIERPAVLRDFTATWSHVACDVALGESGLPTKLIVGFLVGCDGGSSFVRKKLGFEFQGDVAKESFVSAHAKFEDQAGSADYTDVWFSKNAAGADPLTAGMCVSLPLHNGEHLINLDLDESQQEKYVTQELDAHGLRKLKELTIDDILAMFRARTACPGVTVRPESVTWIAHYRVNSRLAEHFGSGRVYLSGDACHCHSPVGGQGMNMGIQDAKNLSWKLAAVVKKTARQSLLLSYEEERRGVDAKITKGVELATSAFSNRNPVVFFLRGRPQRVVGATVNMLPDAAKTSRGWAYDTSSLSYEHWERPSVWSTFKDICRHPYRVYRRRQNLYRWSGAVGARVCAGDSVPPVLADGVNLYDMIKASRGWTLLLFEGDAGANEEAGESGLPVLSYAQLQALGQELRQDPDREGYVGFVDTVVVFPSSDLEAHTAFGVLGQCLFAVRPDTYVGLRSEPVRKGAVTRYFESIGGIGVPAYPCPAGSTNFDPFPALLLPVVALAVASLVYAVRS